jgi:transcriptional regulator with XRE-family HTH domain
MQPTTPSGPSPMALARAHLNYSLKDLNFITGIDVSALSKIERGVLRIGPKRRALIAIALEVSEDALFGPLPDRPAPRDLEPIRARVQSEAKARGFECCPR